MKAITVSADWHIAEKFDLDQIRRLALSVIQEANTRDELDLLGDLVHADKISGRELDLLIDLFKEIKVPTKIVVGNHETANGEYSLLDWVPKLFPLIEVYQKPVVIEEEGVRRLLGHFNIEESVMGAYDFQLRTGVSLQDLNVDLACLGHIHKYQIIKGPQCTAFHPGSLFYIDYGECKDTKCFVNLDLSEGKFDITPKVVTPDIVVEIHLTPEDDLTCLKDLPRTAKVKIIVEYSNPLLNKKEVQRRLDTFSFKDKRVLFRYHEDRTTLENKVKLSHQGLIEFNAFLKDKNPKAVSIIHQYLKQVKQ